MANSFTSWQGRYSNHSTRSKGKVERAVRSIKEAYETLYHFHRPETEQQANEWLLRHLIHNYNLRQHRSEPHSRLDDWLVNSQKESIREMCACELFWRFAREPERRKVGF